MTDYVLLFQDADRGIRNVVDTIKRAADAREIASRFGVRIVGFLGTMGNYDGVIVAQAPSEDAIAAFTSTTSATDDFKTKILRAFQISEFDSVLSALQ